jgi:uncharacterized membrane protein
MDSSRRIYLVFLSLVALWCSLIIAAPLLQDFSDNTRPLAALLYRLFSRICHQLDERSYHLDRHAWAVCIRCSAIYFAFLAGLCCYPLVRRFDNRTIPSLLWLMAASFPMLVDVGFSVLGIHESTSITRLVSGACFGIVLPFFILPPLVDAITKLSHRSSPTKGELLYARKTK